MLGRAMKVNNDVFVRVFCVALEGCLREYGYDEN